MHTHTQTDLAFIPELPVVVGEYRSYNQLMYVPLVESSLNKKQ